MEPIDSGAYLQEAALALAVQHCQHRPEITSKTVLEIAEYFLKWLRRTDI